MTKRVEVPGPCIVVIFFTLTESLILSDIFGIGCFTVKYKIVYIASTVDKKTVNETLRFRSESIR